MSKWPGCPVIACANDLCNEGCQAMTEPDAWRRDCMKWRGQVLTGKYCHWCYDWDELPVDETTPEWPCSCAPALTSSARRALEPKP